MIEWEVRVNDPDWYGRKLSEREKQKIIKNVNDSMCPFMEYFCKRLSVLDSFTLKEAEKIFGTIIDDMSVFSHKIVNNEFVIVYSKLANVVLKDSIQQIYREQKINKIL